MNENEAPRKKRKYTKRAKMLLRSNNDYIDHTYWPRMYAKNKDNSARMAAKYGVKLPPKGAIVNGEVKVRKITETDVLSPIEKDEPLFHIPIVEEND